MERSCRWTDSPKFSWACFSFWTCFLLWFKYLPPLNPHVEALTLIVTVLIFGDGTFGKRWGLRAVMRVGVSWRKPCPYKKTTRGQQSLPTVWAKVRGWPRTSLEEPDLTCTLTSSFQMWKIKVSCLRPWYCMISQFSSVRLLVILWPASCQAPLPTEPSRWEHGCRLTCCSMVFRHGDRVD